jgi:formylmethanofuran dehydrogenase subunit E
MVKLRCQDCGEIIDGSYSDIDDSECDCGGDYEKLNSPDDTYEESDKEDESISCNECGEDAEEGDYIHFEEADVNICRRCIDKKYPQETKIEYKEKIVEKLVYVDKEGVPIGTQFDLKNKTRFD